MVIWCINFLIDLFGLFLDWILGKVQSLYRRKEKEENVNDY